MNPEKVRRDRLKELTDLPNVGPRLAASLVKIGIDQPADLVGRDAFEMYQTLCQSSGRRYDPCVLDVFISVTRFMAGGAAQPWWACTGERKQQYPDV